MADSWELRTWSAHDLLMPAPWLEAGEASGASRVPRALMYRGEVNGQIVYAVPEFVADYMPSWAIGSLCCRVGHRRRGLYISTPEGRRAEVAKLAGLELPGAVFDWAVPINADGTYPHGGDAVTVYRHRTLPAGVVPWADVVQVAQWEVARSLRAWLFCEDLRDMARAAPAVGVGDGC